MESWQNGYCTGLENRRPQGLGGSNPSLSAHGRFDILTKQQNPSTSTLWQVADADSQGGELISDL